jgi:hypothetical protein
MCYQFADTARLISQSSDHNYSHDDLDKLINNNLLFKSDEAYYGYCHWNQINGETKLVLRTILQYPRDNDNYEREFEWWGSDSDNINDVGISVKNHLVAFGFTVEIKPKSFIIGWHLGG